MKTNPELSQQYNAMAETYSTQAHASEAESKSRDRLRQLLPSLAGKRVLDIGCGNGLDAAFYQSQGAQAYGIDPSEAMLQLAVKNCPNGTFFQSVAEAMPLQDASIDLVVSYYALQVSPTPEIILKEAARVLRPKGTLVVLTKDPLRQFFENQRTTKNYFQQEIISTTIFNGTIQIREPTHTLDEYISDVFLRNFELKHFEQGVDFPASNQINGDTYPCYLIMCAERRAKSL